VIREEIPRACAVDLCPDSRIRLVVEDADYGMELAFACRFHRGQVHRDLALRVAERLQSEAPAERLPTIGERFAAALAIAEALPPEMVAMARISAKRFGPMELAETAPLYQQRFAAYIEAAATTQNTVG
jgi:hypothetical protein